MPHPSVMPGLGVSASRNSLRTYKAFHMAIGIRRPSRVFRYYSGVEPRPGSVTIINMCRSASVFNRHRTCFDGSFPHPYTTALDNASCTASAISSSFCSGTSSRPNVSEMALTTAPIASASAGIRRSSNSESVGFSGPLLNSADRDAHFVLT